MHQHLFPGIQTLQNTLVMTLSELFDDMDTTNKKVLYWYDVSRYLVQSGLRGFQYKPDEFPHVCCQSTSPQYHSYWYPPLVYTSTATIPSQYGQSRYWNSVCDPCWWKALSNCTQDRDHPRLELIKLVTYKVIQSASSCSHKNGYDYRHYSFVFSP